MNKAGIHHQSGDTWCFALDGNTLHIRLRTAADDIDRIEIIHADPFEWYQTNPGETERKMAWKAERSWMNRCGTNGIHDFWEITVQPPFKRLKYWFKLYKGNQAWEYGEKALNDIVDEGNVWNVFMYPYLHEKEVFNAPQWIGETVWYQIFPERYRNGNPSLNPPGTKAWQTGPVTNHEFYGGNIPGIIDKLDHIAGMGFNGIYLTPIFYSPSVHKYDTTDYMKIDPTFGTEEDLKTLVRECHKRGIRIVLDAVFNHCGVNFVPWKDVVKNGEKSHYRDWFMINGFPLIKDDKHTWDSHYANFETFAFTTNMPKLNTSNPELREYLLGVAEYYIKECDIDGWRLDVANEIDHEFWQFFRKRVKSIKPEAYIVAEIWHNAISWLRGDQYDAVMNYLPGMAIANFLKNDATIPDGETLSHRLTTLDMSYPVNVQRAMFNLLDSHDTDRLLHKLAGDLAAARQAWLLLALMPGSPCFYYGSEYAMVGAGDPDCRRCMPWDEADQNKEQYDFIKYVVQLRREHATLCSKGRHEWLFSKKHTGLFGMRIEYKGRRLTVLINHSKNKLTRANYAELLSPEEVNNPDLSTLEAEGYAVSVTG